MSRFSQLLSLFPFKHWLCRSAGLLLLGFFLIGGFVASPAEALILDQPMRGATAPGWVIGDAAYLTASSGVDPAGDGWLRLTDAANDKAGYAFYDSAFDISSGVVIQFDYATWGGNGADGYSIYLFDGSYDAATFSAGASGGSLGYAQKQGTGATDDPGITGGYIGVGVDEYGNFANPSEGRIGGPGQRANSVSVRGPFDHPAGAYNYIGGTAAGVGTLWFNQAYRPGQSGSQYRKVVIYLTPVAAPNYMRVDVYMQFGYNQPLATLINTLYTGRPIPTSVKVGYAASTGGATNVHEIRNLTIDNLPTDINLAMAKSSSAPIIAPGGALTYTVTARNYGPNLVTVANNVPIVDTLPVQLTGATWTCVGSGGGTCGAASGSGNLNTTATLPFNAAATYTITGTVDAGTPLGTTFNNTATLSAPSGITDYNPADNSATVATTVSNGNITISGTVYNDNGAGGGVPHNGVRDGAESGVNAGLTYYAKLFRPSDLTNTVVAPVPVNAANGTYSFVGVPGYGDYVVILSSTNTANAFNPSFPSANWIYVSPLNYTRGGIVANGANLTSQNFFVYNGSRISGKVIKDDGFNGSISTAYDGILNAAEAGIAGVTLSLRNNTGGTTYDTTTTSANGDFVLFTNTPSKTLRIYETNLPAYTSVSWNAGSTGGAYTIGGEYIQFAYNLYTDYANVLFGDIPPPVTITFTPTPRSSDGTPAAPIYYPHVFNATARGSVGFNVNSRTQGAWPAVGFVRDLDCDGSFDASEPDITAAISLEANTDLCILVRETIQAGATPGTTDTIVTRATFTTGLASQSANVSDTTTVVPSPNLSTSTKRWVDLNGSDHDPGDVIRYTITLIETAGVAASDVNVTDDIPDYVDPLVAGNITIPTGSNNSSTYVGNGANGTGHLNITGISVPANGSVTISYTVTIAAGTSAGTVIDNSATVIVPGGVGANPDAPPLTVSGSAIPGSGNKLLYLYDGTSIPNFKLSRTRPSGLTGSALVTARGGSQIWALDPALSGNVTTLGNTVPVTLWLTNTSNQERTRSIEVRLACSSAPATYASYVNTNLSTPNTPPRSYTFDLTGNLPMTCATGDSWQLTVYNRTGNNGRDIRVYAMSGANNSYVDLDSQNVINVDSITFHTDSYANGGGSTVTSLAAGSQVWIQSTVSDPFGSYDINANPPTTLPTVTLTDAAGASVVTSAMTEIGALTTTGTKTFEYGPYTIPSAGPGGAWTARVDAAEGTEGTVSDYGLGSLTVILPMPMLMIMKSASTGNASPGDAITYSVTVLNSGSGSASQVHLDDDLSSYTAWSVDPYGTGSPFQLFQLAPDPDGAGPQPADSGVTIGTPVFYDANNAVITPTADLNGLDANVERWVLPMTGVLVPGGQFRLQYEVKVE